MQVHSLETRTFWRQSAPIRTPPEPPVIGLALSGGTLKAAAHVGVLAALEALGVRPQYIAGTSAGSYVAALYAHGYSPSEMVSMVTNFPGASLLDYGFPLWSSAWSLLRHRIIRLMKSEAPLCLPTGLLRGAKLETYFREALCRRQPEVPYYVIACDLYTGAPVVYKNTGDAAHVTLQQNRDIQSRSNSVVAAHDIARVIRGSCALPGILTPIVVGKHLLVDGGLRNYVPVEVLRDAGCTRIIAVNLYRLQQNWKPETFVQVLTRSFDIILQETIDGDIKGDDVLSIMPNVSDVSFISFRDMEYCVHAGRTAVAEKAERIRAFLGPSWSV